CIRRPRESWNSSANSSFISNNPENRKHSAAGRLLCDECRLRQMRQWALFVGLDQQAQPEPVEIGRPAFISISEQTRRSAAGGHDIVTGLDNCRARLALEEHFSATGHEGRYRTAPEPATAGRPVGAPASDPEVTHIDCGAVFDCHLESFRDPGRWCPGH